MLAMEERCNEEVMADQLNDEKPGLAVVSSNGADSLVTSSAPAFARAHEEVTVTRQAPLSLLHEARRDAARCRFLRGVQEVFVVFTTRLHIFPFVVKSLLHFAVTLEHVWA